jgi:hypothetical protein
MELPFQPCKDKSCRWGGWRGKKWYCCCDPSQYGLCSSGGYRPKKNTMGAQNTSTNKQMVAALWRALSDSDVKKAGNSRGVWLPLTKARLNAAYTKVFGL